MLQIIIGNIMPKYFKYKNNVAYLCIYIAITLLRSVGATNQNNIKYKEIEIVYDLPVKSDLNVYLGALEKVIDFVNTHKYYVDLNLSFGVFLTNANLKSLIALKSQNLSSQKRSRLEILVKVTEDILRYFSKALQKFLGDHDKQQEFLVSLVTLFIANDTAWPVQLPKFNVDLLKKTTSYSRKGLEKIYLKWAKYKKLVFDGTLYVPTAEQSDTCLALLAQNPIDHNGKLPHCQIPYGCVKGIVNGSNYSYAITHRLLFLLLARFGRGCAVLTQKEDKQLKDNLCATMYNEAEFIAHHDFQLPDLLVEINLNLNGLPISGKLTQFTRRMDGALDLNCSMVALCTLEGHAQFLRRSWLDELLDFQTAVGCFNVTRPEEEYTMQSIHEKVPWQFVLSDHMILGGTCNAHITSIASAMLASAVRYVMQIFY